MLSFLTYLCHTPGPRYIIGDARRELLSKMVEWKHAVIVHILVHVVVVVLVQCGATLA